MACMMISGNGRRFYTGMWKENTHWMFPNMAMASNPVVKMNQTLKSLVLPTDPMNEGF